MSVQQKIWPVLVGIVLFPLLQYGLTMRSGNMALALVSTVSAYMLAIWLYRGVAVAVLLGYQNRILIVGFVAAVAAVMVSPFNQIYTALANTVMIPVAGIVVARTLLRRDSGLRAYIFGAAVVAVGGFAIFAPQWDLLLNGFRAIGEENVSLIKETMATMGYHADAAEEYADQFIRLWNGIVRIIPAMTIMSLITQFSIGFLWLLMRPGSVSGEPIKLEPFSRWKVPFGLTPVLLVALICRLVGGDTITLVADNVLLALSVYYCVGGLALAEHSLKKIKIPIIVKVVFYIMLIMMGVLGYIVAVLLGFIDSFADWRKVNEPPIELKTE